MAHNFLIKPNLKFDFLALSQVVDEYTGKRIDIIVYTFVEDVKKNSPPMEEKPLVEDEEADLFCLTQSKKPDNNKGKELEVGDEIVVVGKFVESK